MSRRFLAVSLAGIVTVGLAVPAFAVPIAPEADYFIPQPDQAAFANRALPASPQTSRQDMFPDTPAAPLAAIAPSAQTIMNRQEFYPQPQIVAQNYMVPTPQTAPTAATFIPQAQIAPRAQEFLP